MKTSEIKELTTKEIEERIEEERSLITKQRMNHAVSPLENPMKIRSTRRLVAKLITELNLRKTLEN